METRLKLTQNSIQILVVHVNCFLYCHSPLTATIIKKKPPKFEWFSHKRQIIWSTILTLLQNRLFTMSIVILILKS